MEKEFIKFRKPREFGDIFNDTFAFIKQEAAPLFRTIATIALPVVLLTVIFAGLIQSKQAQVIHGGISASYFTYVILTVVLLSFSQQVLMLLIFSYIKLYDRRGSGNFTTADVFQEILINFLPTLGATFLWGMLIAIGFVCCIIPGIYLGISLSMFIPIMLFEDNDFGSSFSRSFQLTNKQWWWTFLIIFVYIILTGTFKVILSIPLFIFTLSNLFTGKVPVEELNSSVFYIAYNSLVTFITIFFTIIIHLAIAFQYFNIVERFEGESLSDKIDQIAEDEEPAIE